MEPEFLCFTKTLGRADVERNLEIPNGSPFLPVNDELMLVSDPSGTTYQFRASTRKGGRRSLTLDWHTFSMAKNLRVGENLRIYRLGNGNEYVVKVEVELLGHPCWVSP